MLVGEGATRFAREQGFPKRDLLTPEAKAAWQEWLKTSRYQPVANIENRRTPSPGSARDHDTIGILARGADGRFAGACTTSGMAFKLHGRVGDSPQAGCDGHPPDRLSGSHDLLHFEALDDITWLI